jgi:hypothetical protein
MPEEFFPRPGRPSDLPDPDHLSGQAVHIGHEVGGVRHEGLKRLIEDDDHRPIRPDLVSRSVAFSVLRSAQDVDGLLEPPGWRIHQLCGNRSGT